MKKILLTLLCACVLLSGCHVGSEPTVQTDPPPTEAPTIQPDVSDLPLLEQGSALDESPNLLYIPNDTMEGMEQPEMRLLGNGLLLSEHRNGTMILNHISLENGALITSAAIPAGEGTKVIIGSGEIALCDRELGMITILDEGFQVLRTYPVTGEGDDWYLNQELDTLFVFDFDRGLVAWNLETGDENWLVDNAIRVSCLGGGNAYLLVQYTDRADQKTYGRCLNLSTASMETLPVEAAVTGGIRQGELWLLQGQAEQILVQGEDLCSVAWDGDVRLLSPRRHLLAMDASRRDLTIFETDGAFISRCSLPQNSHAITGTDFVWSGYWSGYFFTDFLDGTSRLMFWDVSAETEGDNLELPPLGAAEKPEPVLEPQLYEQAAELSRRYGLDIRIGEQCYMNYTNYNTHVLKDSFFVREALDILEYTLSQYPEGFFDQLRYGSIEYIRIELVGSLTTKDGVKNRRDTASGFAQNMGSYYLVALDGYTMRKETVYHEISHIIDKRLDWDAFIREDALYSEESWMNLQPEGFEYAMSYAEEVPFDGEYDYFVSDYSLTFPTEDRAELMALAMVDNGWAFEPGNGCMAKMQFYADCIRDCFDTTGWPETTRWEQHLK